jgi:hypothetical protein
MTIVTDDPAGQSVLPRMRSTRLRDELRALGP